ncbi:ZP domain-containing protein [Nephila pilipes]|uniref:ZP domain-containing protein n=1 Tax=Nephila pilipes TaxID=299642 RepID=A0A8X6PET3_NEPPI|nr:ZP domain-containing protein [Nephila pilipes]
MSHDVKEGVEYFNTVVIQPHSKLVTSLGRGFHVRCRYQTKNNKTVGSDATNNNIGTTPSKELAPMPTCAMHIYVGRPNEHHIAEHARIGEYLTLVISIENQDTYGLKVTNCIVKDGLGWSEQPLINNDGCPIDPDLMGPFEYDSSLTRAQVSFPAHKFPFTASVYYKCNVKLCQKKVSGGCDDVPPVCDATGHNVRRRRRKRQSDAELQDKGSLEKLRLQDEDLRDKSVEVYGGLYVNEVDEDEEPEASSSLSPRSDDEFCVSTRKFAIGIAIAGVLLMLAVILLVACIVHRRRRRKGTSTTGSSIYSGPYSNHAYSRD